jgi:hypothetical protein
MLAQLPSEMTRLVTGCILMLAGAVLPVSCSHMTSKMTARPRDLRALFPTEPIPAQAAIVIPLAGDEDRVALARLLSGKSWPNISYDYLRKNYPGPLSEAFSYLTEQGQAYFLPAFVTMTLEKRVEVDDLPETMLSILAHGSLTERLSKEQLEFLLQFFQAQFKGNDFYSTDLVELSRRISSCNNPN